MRKLKSFRYYSIVRTLYQDLTGDIWFSQGSAFNFNTGSTFDFNTGYQRQSIKICLPDMIADMQKYWLQEPILFADPSGYVSESKKQ